MIYLNSFRTPTKDGIDETPPKERKWTELDCVRVYHDFFVEQNEVFD